jgi:hypothetical protein
VRCTECNKEIKPVVAIDIDGTLGDYHGHFLEFAEAYFHREASWHYTGRERFRDWCCRAFDIDLTEFRAAKLAYRQGGQKRTMPIYPGAADLCHAVRREGAELWLTTTRPFLRLDNVDPDTREWLRRHGIEYDYMLYDKEKYKELYSLVGADRVAAVVDDLLTKSNEAELYFRWKAVVWRRTVYNGAEGVKDIGYWDLREIQDVVLERINEWKEHHNERAECHGGIAQSGDSDRASSRVGSEAKHREHR